jgi:hypothetical protein
MCVQGKFITDPFLTMRPPCLAALIQSPSRDNFNMNQ